MNLARCELAAEHAEPLATLLRKNNKISDLNLAGNRVTWPGVKTLCEALNREPTEEEKRTHMPQSPDGRGSSPTRGGGFYRTAEDIAALSSGADPGAKSSGSPTKTDAPASPSKDDADAEAKAKRMKALRLALKVSLTSLDISGNNLGSQSCFDTMGDLLKANGSLLILKLDGNGLGDEGVSSLAMTIRCSRTCKLTYLSLQENNVHTEGLVAVAAMLETNSTITTLRLDHNDLDDDDVMLESRNEIGTTLKGAEALADALLRNGTLTELTIELEPFKQRSPRRDWRGIT